jgi:5-methylcytosine-specific restriction endonuclease McrA
MDWSNFALYNAKAIKAAKAKVRRKSRKIERKAILEAAKKRIKPEDVQAAIYRLATAKANKALGNNTPQKPQYQALPSYRPGMKAQDFYQTREWKELRYKALAKHGNNCQCCGAPSKPLHVDHIKPRSKHPELELELDNLQILCEPCNIGKSNKDATDWR